MNYLQWLVQCRTYARGAYCSRYLCIGENVPDSEEQDRSTVTKKVMFMIEIGLKMHGTAT
jgi:hypothetical protein